MKIKPLRITIFLFSTTLFLGVLGVIFYLFFLSPNQPAPNSSQLQHSKEELQTQKSVYINERFRYIVTIPLGYRLASDVMRFMNTIGTNPIENFREENAEYVAITRSSKLEELSFLDDIRKKASRNGINLNNRSVIPAEFLLDLSRFSLTSTIEIYPVPVRLEQVKVLASKLKKRDHNAPSDFMDITLHNGIRATRFTDRSLDGSISEVVYIPFLGSIKLRGGDSIHGILIKMEKDPQFFDQSAFDTVVNSFSFW